MSGRKMHVDEVDIDPALVRRLLESQFPQWADLEIDPVPSGGTDNVMYRLGADMAVRLPRIERTKKQVEQEAVWLPILAPRLPLAVPEQAALGAPGEGYPFPWAIVPWLPGIDAGRAAVDMDAAASDLQTVPLRWRLPLAATRLLQRSTGEPIRFELHPDEAAGFLAETGWGAAESLTHTDLYAKFLRSTDLRQPPSVGSYVCKATK